MNLYDICLVRYSLYRHTNEEDDLEHSYKETQNVYIDSYWHAKPEMSKGYNYKGKSKCP